MQFKPTLDEKTIKKDPLSLMCHPVEHIKTMAAVIIHNSDSTKYPPFEEYNYGQIRAIGAIIENSIDDIAYLVDLAESKENNLFHENKHLKAEVYDLKKQLVDISNEQEWKDNRKLDERTRALECCLAYLEDPEDKPDMKTMAEKLRKQL